MPTKPPFYPSIESNRVGDTMNCHPSKGRLRFWLQNCNGLKPHDNSNLNHLFTQIHEYNMHFSRLQKQMSMLRILRVFLMYIVLSRADSNQDV